jgi:hypothetical protein
VPKGAKFGFVVTRLPDPRYCGVGLFYIASTQPPEGYSGTSAGPVVQFQYTRAHKRGTAVYLAESGGTCRVGGAIVVPRWMSW